MTEKKSWLRDHGMILLAGIVVGLAALVLQKLGNPKNMGFCIACFERDIAGALGLHSAAKVQYLRPEIIGIVLGAMIAAMAAREFRAKCGSSPASRFLMGLFVMIGALVFLGCPLRMVIRLGGGDLTAVAGFLGFFAGILVGVLCLKKGFSLGRAYPAAKGEGLVLPAVMVILLALLLFAPSLLRFSDSGPGSMHAFWAVSLAAGLAVGVFAQRSRLCMAGGLRDAAGLPAPHRLRGHLGHRHPGKPADGGLSPLRPFPAHRPQPVPVVLPGHGPGGLGLRPAGRLPPAPVDPGRRRKRRLRRYGAGHGGRRRRGPQLRPCRRRGQRGRERGLRGRRHRYGG